MNFGCQAEVLQFTHHRQYLFVSGNLNSNTTDMETLVTIKVNKYKTLYKCMILPMIVINLASSRIEIVYS